MNYIGPERQLLPWKNSNHHSPNYSYKPQVRSYEFNFPLRSNYEVSLKLPFDLTRRELARLLAALSTALVSDGEALSTDGDLWATLRRIAGLRRASDLSLLSPE